jgi:hypothetical protein
VTRIMIEDTTYKRLESIRTEITHIKKKDINYDDVLNELIDLYQENVWGQLGGTTGGG